VLVVFHGEEVFKWGLPVDASDLTYFRRRLGEEGVEKILQVLIAIYCEKADEEEVATVQEKNIYDGHTLPAPWIKVND